MPRFIIQFYEFIVRLWKWLPILWQDRDFNYIFFYKIMYHKLYQMRHSMQTYSYHLDKQNSVKQITIALCLLDRIIKDDYCAKDWNDYWLKYPSTLFSEIVRDKSWKEDVTIKNLIKKEHEIKQYDLEYFFKHLKKYGTKWWH